MVDCACSEYAVFGYRCGLLSAPYLLDAYVYRILFCDAEQGVQEVV